MLSVVNSYSSDSCSPNFKNANESLVPSISVVHMSCVLRENSLSRTEPVCNKMSAFIKSN